MNGHLEPHNSACSCRNFRSSPVMLLDICSCVLELATNSSSSAHLRAVAWHGENWEWVPWKLPWWEKLYIYIYIYVYIYIHIFIFKSYMINIDEPWIACDYGRSFMVCSHKPESDIFCVLICFPVHWRVEGKGNCAFISWPSSTLTWVEGC